MKCNEHHIPEDTFVRMLHHTPVPISEVRGLMGAEKKMGLVVQVLRMMDANEASECQACLAQLHRVAKSHIVGE